MNAFEWVAQAADRSEKPKRPFLRAVHVIDGEILASDGARLHWTSTNLAPGQYDPYTGAPLSIPYRPALNLNRGKGRLHTGHVLKLENLRIVKSCGIQVLRVAPGFGFNMRYVLAALNHDRPEGVGYWEGASLTGCNGFGLFTIAGIKVAE